MGRGPDVTSNPEHDSVVCIFTCFCGNGCSSKNCQLGALKKMYQLNKLTGGITLHVIPILFIDDRLEGKKRRKRWVEGNVQSI